MEPITLKPSSLRMFVLLCGSVAGVAGGFFALKHGSGSGLWVREILGWCSILFFGIGVVVFAMTLIPGASYLRLKREGFEVCNLFRSHTTSWSQVECFGTYTGSKSAFKNKVMLNLVPDAKRTPKMTAMCAWARARWIRRHVASHLRHGGGYLGCRIERVEGQVCGKRAASVGDEPCWAPQKTKGAEAPASAPFDAKSTGSPSS